MQTPERGRRTAVVTGGTGGIGRAVAVELARAGHRVLIVGRDAERGAAVLAELDEAGPGAGHALLRLLPLLSDAPSGRVVLVANAGKYRDTLDLDDLQLRRGGRGLWVAGRTQFANDLLAIELAERARGSRIDVTCVYPGPVATDVFRNARGLSRPVHAIATVLHRLVAAPPATAAQTPVFLADDPAATGLGGSFFGPRRRRRRIPKRAHRPDRRAALWAASEQLVQPWLTDPDTATIGQRQP